MAKPKISVVIPAYNEEHYIGPCLEALKRQTYTDFELIVVDNNCTDKTVQIARSFGAKVIREKRQGMIPARECGFAAASGDIVLRTDADTAVPPDWVQQCLETFETHKDIVAVTGSFMSPTKQLPDWPFRLYTDVYFHVHHFLTGHGNLHGPNMAVKKSVLRNISPCQDDENVHEDVDLACHIAPHGKIVYIRKIRVPYSLRRIKQRPLYTAAEYTLRYIRSVLRHHFGLPGQKTPH